MKDIPNIIKEPNQAYLLKSHIDSINIPWTNIYTINKDNTFFKIYSSPNNGHFKIDYNLAGKKMYLEILDIFGNILDHIFLSDMSNSIYIDKSQLPWEVYIIRARTSQGLNKTERMIIFK